MSDPTTYDPTDGSARELIDQDEAAALKAAGVLVTDERRRRPLYFDGRFLAARDLTREQTYFLSRQADLGRAGGAGVVAGLNVSQGATARSLHISAGHGITPSGETVVLTEDLAVDLSDISEIQRLNVAFGLSRLPKEPVRTRSGLFVVALRPVEYTANPIASYPTALDGQRTVQDGDIIEGVAVALIPYPDTGETTELDARRAIIARQIFVENSRRATSNALLPLAMIALERGVVRWVDPYLVRREAGADQADILGLGFAPRALREAQIRQYSHHLTDILERLDSTGRSRRFAATDYFQSLPPVGQVPAAVVNSNTFTQNFFPPEIQVDLSLIPEDELPALVEEGLLLPPIDLTLGGDALESTSVLLLLPMPREQVYEATATLPSATRSLTVAAPGLLAKRSPLEVLRGIRAPLASLELTGPENTEEAVWRSALANSDMLWYVRRRNLSYSMEVAGTDLPLVGGGPFIPYDPFDVGYQGPDGGWPEGPYEPGEGDHPGSDGEGPDDNLEIPGWDPLDIHMRTEGLSNRYTALLQGIAPDIQERLRETLLLPNFTRSGISTVAGLSALEEVKAEGKGLDLDKALAVLDPIINTARLGEGLEQLEKIDRNTIADFQNRDALAKVGPLPEMSRLGLDLAEARTKEVLAPSEARNIIQDMTGTAVELNAKVEPATLEDARAEMRIHVRDLIAQVEGIINGK